MASPASSVAVQLMLGYLRKRLPLMLLTFAASWVLHTYLLVVQNEGFSPGSRIARWLNVTGNLSTSVIVWLVGSGLLWSFVYSFFKTGPVGAVKGLVSAPLQIVRMFATAGAAGAGALCLGTGLALVLRWFLPVQGPASLGLAIAWTYFGVSVPGQMLAGILARFLPSLVQVFKTPDRGKAAFTLREASLVSAAIAPGFLLGAVLPSNMILLSGIALLIGGFFLLFKPRGWVDVTAQGSFFLLVGAVTAALYMLIECLFPRSARADDGGWTESGGTLAGWWNSPGSGTAIGMGVGPAAAAGCGPMVRPFGGPELPGGSPEQGPAFNPPDGLPEGVAGDDGPRSEHPACDEIYAKLKDAIRRYRETQKGRNDIWDKLEKARKIHIANQMKLIIRSGLEIGGYAAAGVEGVHAAGQTVGKSLQTIKDEIKAAQARAEMLAEPLRQLKSRLALIEGATGELGKAQTFVNGLMQEQQALHNWAYDETRKWYGRHPSLADGPSSQTMADLAEIETNKIARDALMEQIQAQGFASPAQRDRLSQLLQSFNEAHQRQLQRETRAMQSGWVPDLENHLQQAGSEKYQRWRSIDAQLQDAQRTLKDAELAAPPSLLQERDRLRSQLEGMMSTQEQGGIPTNLVEGGTTPRTDQERPGGERGSGTAQAVQPTTWEVPKPEGWALVIKEGLEGTLADIFSPFARLWRWAFVGDQQSPEEVGRKLKQGMDTIQRLTDEFAAKQREIDGIRGEVEWMRGDLERCNKSRRPAVR